MIVVYSIDNKAYGYMCFKDGYSIKVLYDYICDCLRNQKIKIIYARKFSDIPITKVLFYNDSKYKIEYIDTILRGVEDVGKIYTHLYNKYGNSNILGFL